MEYLPGIPLDRLIKDDGPQPAARVVHLVKQICASLAEAHRVGLVHRDVKPANMMLCERGGLYDVVKVLDFGLVKEIATDDAGLTAAHHIVGTPLYMAPESINGSTHRGRPQRRLRRGRGRLRADRGPARVHGEVRSRHHRAPSPLDPAASFGEARRARRPLPRSG